MIGNGASTSRTVVTLCGVPFSPNLGDGVISECLVHVIRRLVPEAEVRVLDLAGRQGYGNGLGEGRSRLIRLLLGLPRRLRPVVVYGALRVLVRMRLRRLWEQSICGSTLAIVGGGHLLADADLNFPVKISGIVDIAATQGVPVAFHSCGVSERWSHKGYGLFHRALRHEGVRHVSARDEPSALRLRRHLGDDPGQAVKVAVDPGILAAEVYGEVRRHRDTRPVVGVGVADPENLAYSAGLDWFGGRAFWIEFFGALVTALSRNAEVIAFTNGAFEDEAFLDTVLHALPPGVVRRAPRPTRPDQLAHTIANFDALIAHRLHASVIGYSYRIPTVGLAWDDKVSAFYELTRRPRHVLVPSHDADRAARAVLVALEEGIDEITHRAVTDRARSDVESTLGAAGIEPPAPRRSLGTVDRGRK